MPSDLTRADRKAAVTRLDQLAEEISRIAVAAHALWYEASITAGTVLAWV